MRPKLFETRVIFSCERELDEALKFAAQKLGVSKGEIARRATAAGLSRVWAEGISYEERLPEVQAAWRRGNEERMRRYLKFAALLGFRVQLNVIDAAKELGVDVPPEVR